MRLSRLDRVAAAVDEQDRQFGLRDPLNSPDLRADFRRILPPWLIDLFRRHAGVEDWRTLPTKEQAQLRGAVHTLVLLADLPADIRAELVAAGIAIGGWFAGMAAKPLGLPPDASKRIQAALRTIRKGFREDDPAFQQRCERSRLARGLPRALT